MTGTASREAPLAGAFWFDAKDANRDGRVDITIEAAPQAADKNTILNGLWAFNTGTPADSPAVLAGQFNVKAVARLEVANPGGASRNDLILVHVTNRGSTARKLQPRLIVDTTLPLAFRFGQRRALVNEHEVISASLGFKSLVEETKHGGCSNLRRSRFLPASALPSSCSTVRAATSFHTRRR